VKPKAGKRESGKATIDNSERGMTDEIKSNKLKLVADNDEKQLVRQRDKTRAERAAIQLSCATRALAANILRIIAGAGKDYELFGQMIEVLKAYDELHPMSGRASYPYPPSTPMVEGLHELDWRRGAEGYYQPTENDLARRRDGSADLDDAKADVVQAALRMTAAQLMAQPTQESVADSQLVSAIRRFEEARQVRNERRHQEWRRKPRTPQDIASRRSHLASPGNAAPSRTSHGNVGQILDAAHTRQLTKGIGMYDALDEQNRKRRETAKPKPKQP
jgi:hypothetical protein